MPDQSANQAALRGTHEGAVYVSPILGTLVLQGTISAQPASTSALDLSYTLNSGSAASVLPGMQVVLTSSGGSFKGVLSVRYAGTISSTNLPVREFSFGDVQIVVGDILKVYDVPLLTDKLVAGDETFAPDHATYSDQNSDPAPVAVSGGWFAGWLGSGGTVDVPFVGSGSYTVDPDSAGSVTHLWAASGGTFVVGTSASADPTIRYSAAGDYLVTHTVTDSSNSKSETQLVRVRVHDAADPPYECLLSSVEGDIMDGFRTSFELFENADLTALPDGTWVIVWADERINGVTQSFGNIVPSRSHIMCIGILSRDRSRANADGGNIEFDVISPLGRLAQLPGFSKVMIREASPDAWNEVRGLTVKKAIIQLARVYTNITNLFDFVFSGFSDADYTAYYLQKQTPAEQLRELAASRRAQITSDRTGRIEVQQRLELTALASRSAITTTLTLATQDLLDYEVSRAHHRTLETQRVRGFTAGATVNDTAFARFPASPGRGSSSLTTERVIVDSTEDIFALCSLIAAWEDFAYFDANGDYQHAPEVRLTLYGAYAHLFQFYREWVKLSGVTTLRGVDMSVFRFVPQRVTVDYADGTATTTLALRAETYAPPEASVDDTPSVEVYPPSEPPVTYPPVVVTPPYDGTGLYANAPTLALIMSDGTLKRTVNAGSQYPNWTNLDLTALTGWAGTGVNAFCANPFSPKYVDGGSSVDAWLTTSTRIIKATNLGGTPTLADQKTISAALAGAVDLLFERGVQNWGVCVVERGSGGLDVHRTINGSTWSTVSDDSDYDTAGGAWRSGAAVSAHTAGKLYTSVMTATGTAPNGIFRVSLDYGATLSNLSSPAAGQGKFRAGIIHVPYQSVDMSIVFYGYRGSATNWRLYRTVGATTVDISPVDSGNAYGMDNNQNRGFATCDTDMNFAVCIGTYAPLGKRGIWYTTNALAAAPTWTVLVAPAAIAAGSYSGVYIVDRYKAYFFGSNGAIGYWDGGATIRSLIGDLSTSASVVGICGL